MFDTKFWPIRVRTVRTFEQTARSDNSTPGRGIADAARIFAASARKGERLLQACSSHEQPLQQAVSVVRKGASVTLAEYQNNTNDAL